MRLTFNPTLPLLLLALLLCSCDSRDPNWKETYPATGEVYVDGQPAGRLRVTCVNANGLDAESPTVSKATTDQDGKFKISTYEDGDGLPEGEYVLTFMWGEYNSISGYGGPDKLKNKYADPKKSEHKFTVVKGEPTDLGRIELTIK